MTNRSRPAQRQLVIFAVARKGGKVVAAGRGQVERLEPGKPPPATRSSSSATREGARIELAAPPTTFK